MPDTKPPSVILKYEINKPPFYTESSLQKQIFMITCS